MAKDGLTHDEIVKLINNLKEETAEYPADMLEERKYTFMKQMVDVNISLKSSKADTKPQQSKSAGPKAGYSGSSSQSKALGTGMSGGSIAAGISLKTLLAIGAVVVLLTAAYLFRDRIEKVLRDNNLIPTEETTAPLYVPNPVGRVTATPTPVAFPTYGPSTPGAGDSGNLSGTTPASPVPFPGNGSGSGSDSGSGVGAGSGTQKTPTPSPPGQSGPMNIFQFLICVLQSGAANCR